MNFTNTEIKRKTGLNIYNTVNGDKSNIKTIINYFIGDTPLNKIFVLVLFMISTFTSLLEIMSYTCSDIAMRLFKTEIFNFSSSATVTWCQLFSIFILMVAINRKMHGKAILSSLFLIITILMKLSIEMRLLTNDIICLCFMTCVAISIFLLMIYDLIEKKSSNQK